MSKLFEAKQSAIENEQALLKRNQIVKEKDKPVKKAQFSEVFSLKTMEGPWVTLTPLSPVYTTVFAYDWLFKRIPADYIYNIRGDVALNFGPIIPEMQFGSYPNVYKYFYKSIYFINNGSEFVDLRLSFSVDLGNQTEEHTIYKIFAKPIIYLASSLSTVTSSKIPKELTITGFSGG